MSSDHYSAHLQALTTSYQKKLAEQGFDQAVISAGSLQYRYQDDQAFPFQGYPLAQQWLPFTIPPELFVVVSAVGEPCLWFPAHQDFWHLTPQIPDGDWQRGWQINSYVDARAWTSTIAGKTAWLGPDHPLRAQLPSVELNPEALLTALNYDRAIKSDWEIDCLTIATERAVRGHIAAMEAFDTGQSEAMIHQSFLAASEQVAPQEPYPGIVALNEAAATLHYERRLFSPPPLHRTLLIDAGAQQHGYASDITRTMTRDQGLFADLLARVDALQQTLCEQTVAGRWFPDLHEQARAGIAEILHETGLCRHAPTVQMEKNIPQTFFPHGLGHLLGLQVHDVGGHWQNRQGHVQSPPETAPALRLTRRLEAGMTLTVEPGLYFIPMLLDRMVKTISDHGCDLELIESLLPFGGIRIEDNLVVGRERNRNLTREAFAGLA